MANKKTIASPPDFESALKQLASIVTQMEEGELNLEDALKQFEQGVTLARQCQQALQQAEQRVQQWIATDEQPVAFNAPEE